MTSEWLMRAMLAFFLGCALIHSSLRYGAIFPPVVPLRAKVSSVRAKLKTSLVRAKGEG
jgi:hypothetical protein